MSASELIPQLFLLLFIFCTIMVDWNNILCMTAKKIQSVCFPSTHTMSVVSTSSDPHLPALSSLYTFRLCMASKAPCSSNYHGPSQLSIWPIQKLFCCHCPMNGKCFPNDFFCLLSSRCQLGSLLSLTSYILVWLIASGW